MRRIFGATVIAGRPAPDESTANRYDHMLVRSGLALPARTTKLSDWAAMLREHFVSLDVSDTDRDARFTGAVRSARVAHLEVATVQSTEQRISRSGGLIRSDGRDCLQIGMIRRGRAWVAQDGRECALVRGDYVLYDTARPFDWRFEGDPADNSWNLEVFTWPRNALAFTEHEVQSLTAVAFDGRTGVSGLLGRFLHDLVSIRMSPDVTATDGGIVDEVGDLVNAVVRSIAVPVNSVRADLYHAAIAVIDEHLSDASLSPHQIAATLSISTRQLHRVFAEQDTTVSRTIRVRRLEGCRRELVARTTAGRSLGEISGRYGFTDLAVFSRAFKQQYGMSPRNYRATVAAP